MIEFIISGKAPSTPNLREHWAQKAKRTKAQRAAVSRKMPAWNGGPLLFVRLTRVGPRSLDTDNLAAALKGHRDAVAAKLRIDDASPLVRWEYAQAKGEPAVAVQAWRDGEKAPPEFEDSLRKPSVVKGRLTLASNYTPPRSPPVDAAKEAEVFAPPETYRCDFCKRERPREHMLLGSDYIDQIRLTLRGFNGKPNGTPWPTAMCFDEREECDRLSDAST